MQRVLLITHCADEGYVWGGHGHVVSAAFHKFIWGLAERETGRLPETAGGLNVKKRKRPAPRCPKFVFGVLPHKLDGLTGKQTTRYCNGWARECKNNFRPHVAAR